MWVVILTSHLPHHVSACWVLDDEGEARRFAAYVTAEVDPAVVSRALSPTTELLNFREEITMSTGPLRAADWATAYHETVADVRRELIESHLAYERAMAPHRAQVFADMAARREGRDLGLPQSVRDAYPGLMMAGSYSYCLAAVLERAEKLDPEIARKLAALADDILQNGGREEICADVWPSPAGGTP